MEKKTTEEMRVAVLAECERLCPDTYKPYIDDDGCVSIWRKLRWNLEPYFEATVANETTVLGVDATNWAMFYRLLGLSERDAVEKKDDTIHNLRTGFESLVGIKYDLEAKNAALVEVLVEVKRYCESGNRGGATRLPASDKFRAEGMYQEVIEALAANEKGGSND